MNFEFINDMRQRSEFQREVAEYKEHLKSASADSITPHASKMVAAMAAQEMSFEADRQDRRSSEEYITKGCRALEVNGITDDLIVRSL